MENAAPLPLIAWDTFYVILGSSAAALTGLQFVVIALISETRTAGSSSAVAAFGTPTVVHFCAALLVPPSSPRRPFPRVHWHSQRVGLGDVHRD